MAQEIPEVAREAALTEVGALLYLAASPDLVDGLSDVEFQILKEHGPELFQLYELLGRGNIIPEGYRLPSGFAKHFEKDVIPDLEAVRSNPAARDEFRSSLRGILSDPRGVESLYRPGGKTYSGELATARKDNVNSGFARATRTKERKV